ncbi:MAG TPA: 4-alpha-glucanotransferase, partial [Rubrobacteraceae bacterium]|nr:4-alpha-glucanotransferase [Rubrobacteraceae bacterium]
GEKPWNQWDKGLAHREPRALQRAEKELATEISYHQFVQYLFYGQWGEIKQAANEAGIEIIGDIPIFVSQDSADVWANQNLFYLDDAGEPTVVSGVPPDYFSETGQLWGNPLYRWDRMREDGYAWWVERITLALTQADAVRIDHFRGFEAYWEIEAGEETAKNGRWVEGPGEDLFKVLRKELGTGGELPLIAEDLGDITPEVHELRKKVGLPGMKVLQFGFSHPENYFLPHNYDAENYVVYTGTHDNDTTPGWWNSASQDERALVRGYLGTEYFSVWDLIRLAHSSVARRAIVPMQDILQLGSEARMNTPGTATGNWGWRMDETSLTPQLATRLRRLTQTYGR